MKPYLDFPRKKRAGSYVMVFTAVCYTLRRPLGSGNPVSNEVAFGLRRPQHSERFIGAPPHVQHEEYDSSVPS